MLSKHLKLPRLFILWIIALMISACGGGGKSNTPPPPPPAHELAGIWYGTIEDSMGMLYTLGVTFSNTGNITSISLDGEVISETATTSLASESVYDITFSDGSWAVIMVDSSATHLGLVDDEFSFGVLQKNAASTLPVYDPDELVGNWTGIRIRLDQNFDVMSMVDGSVTFDANYNAAGNVDEIDFTAILLGSDTAFGVFYYEAVNANQLPIFMEIFLSPDKTFAASWACWSFELFPLNCSFGIWE